jgi:hypothetical protein
MDLEQEDFTVSQFKEFKDEVDHIIPSEFNLVAEKTILLTKLKKNDKYPWQKKKKKSSSYGVMQVSGIFINSTLS